MKMPGNQSTDSGLYEYEANSYFSGELDNNSVEDLDAIPDDDFAEYLWMENEEEFDKQVLQSLEEEALMEQCIEAMLDDENSELQSNANGANENTNDMSTMINIINNLKLDCAEVVKGSNLNPLAAEFVPSSRTLPQETTTSS